MKVLAALVCGLLFALGLGVGGMLQPANVLGFLDFTGAWRPALLFVMCAAIGVYLPAWLWLRRRQPLFGGKMPGAPSHRLDGRLFLGAALFGVGWGLSGICPGPALVILARPSLEVLSFAASVLAGMLAFRAVERRVSP